MKCYDCGRDVARRNIQPTTVHVDHEDRSGYERVDVPLCPGCRLQRLGIPCSVCGELHPDHEGAFKCESPNWPGGCSRGEAR